MTWIEGIATIFGLACVWLTIRQNVWCWPTGLTSYLGAFVRGLAQTRSKKTSGHGLAHAF